MNEQNSRELVLAVAKSGHGFNIAAANVAAQMIEADAIPEIVNAIDEGIIGPELWLLYKDCCQQNLADCILSLQSADALNRLSANYQSKFYVAGT